MVTPKLSFLVVIWRMSRQAENTLISLSVPFQRNVSAEDYEVVVVENPSDDLLGEDRARACGPNVRYFLRGEVSQTPVHALNFAFDQSRAPLVCLMIDGARMVTPRLVEHALCASRLAEHPLIAVPSYHLGSVDQHKNVSAGYDESVERKLLEDVDWRNNGYDLFRIACFSEANPKGFLSPMLESSCLFCTRESFEKIGRADERFDLPGGGSVSIHLYKSLAALPESKFIVLAGEGSFHQYHGGVTTAEVEAREAVLESHRVQLRAIHGGSFEGVHREPFVVGVIPAQAQEFLKRSVECGVVHAGLCKRMGWPEWHHPERG